MVLTRTDENELLTALHSAVFQEDAPWQIFLSRLRARMEADLCRIYIRPSGEAGWHVIDTVRARGPDSESFDPDPPAFDELRSGRVYASDELPGKREGRARHLRVSWPEGGDLALSILRRGADFRARDAAMLGSLAPHLTIALRSRMEIERQRRRNALSEKLLSRFAAGWLLLDTHGHVLDGDPAGMRLVTEGRQVRRAGDGRLRFPYAEAEELLEVVLAERDVTGPPRAAWLGIDPPVQMVLMRPPVDAVRAQSLAMPHCLLLLRAMPEEGVLAEGRYLPKLFRLTRSEAALAARLAVGASLVEAADQLGLTIETARNYSKRIYLKTGAKGQADLVRIVLGGVSMFG
ncbi:MAG TPA: helix-turn-helix transcriptional regulator [Sphingobium sp.]